MKRRKELSAEIKELKYLLKEKENDLAYLDGTVGDFHTTLESEGRLAVTPKTTVSSDADFTLHISNGSIGKLHVNLGIEGAKILLDRILELRKIKHPLTDI